MTTTDETKLGTLYEGINTGMREHELWDLYQETMLDLKDELAEMDYENMNNNPEHPIEFIKRLTELVIEYNKYNNK